MQPPSSARFPGFLVLVGLLAAAGPAHASDAPASDGPCRVPGRTRPSVGLALSGGGARGFAHIGVIRVLRRMRIPIDCVAGTSMGSVVGGLYASGYTPDELVDVATSVDWESAFSDDPGRRFLFFEEKRQRSKFLASIPIRNWRPVLPTGVTTGQKLSNLLALLMLRASSTTDFDQLKIPYRAVATDIVTGAEVELDGSQLPLSEAIRASIAVPGAFTPVEAGELLLVDGGLRNNLPVDVLRRMGADVVIAVNVSTPLLSKEDITSLVAVLYQAISLQIADGTERQLALADVVITPEFGEIGSTDFAKIDAIIAAGEAAARAAAPDVRAVAPRRPRRERRRPRSPHSTRVQERFVIDEIVVEGTLDQRQQEELAAAGIVPGASMSADELEDRMARAWGFGFFDSVGFAIDKREGGRRVLRLKIREREPTLVQLGVGYDELHGAVGLAGLTLSNVPTRDSVLATEVLFGRIWGANLSLLQPALRGTRLYVRPRLFYRDEFQDLYSERRKLARATYRYGGAELGVETILRHLGAVAVGYRWKRAEFTIDGRRRGLPEAYDNVASVWARSELDTLDRLPYPTAGNALTAEYELADQVLGGEPSFNRLTATYQGFWSPWARHTLFAHAFGGTSLGTNLPIYEDFLLGGPRSLLGYERHELRGENALMLRAGYRYRVWEMPLGLGGGVYVGSAFSVAGIWPSADDPVGRPRSGIGGSIGVGLDTIVGPIDFDYGFGEGGRDTFYVSAGLLF